MIRFFALLLVCIASFVSANAASVRSDGATLFVNEAEVLTLRASVAGSSPAARIKTLVAKLGAMDSLGLTVNNTETGSKIYSGGELLILVNKDEAGKAGLTMSGLAGRWAKNLQAAWDLPAIQVDKSSVAMLPGATEVVTLTGSEVRRAPIYLQNGDSTSVTRKGNRLVLYGSALGKSVVTVGDGEEAKTINVRILPKAAAFPQTINVAVVGTPASSLAVEGALATGVKSKLQTADGARVEFNKPPVGDIPIGEKRTYQVRASVTAPEAFPSEGVVSVVVTNLGLGHRRESELWYCNEPENIPGPRTLFLANLKADDPVRMLYHHINASPAPLLFRVLAVNDNDEPARLVLMPGDSKDKNPVLAGVRAADPFFRSWLTGSGEVITLPPHTSIPIAFRRLAPQETSSGLCYLRLLPGGPSSLQVNAEAYAAQPLDATWQAASMTPTPYRETGPIAEGPKFAASLSDLIFPKPFKDEEFIYRAGGPFGFFRVGQKPIERRDPGKPLDGNFGVIYDIKATAENPTSEAVNVELVYETSAGYSGGLFSVDGEIVRLPLMQSKAEAKLAVFKLEPGQSKTINVITIPLSGSSYPVTLALRPVNKLADLKAD